jgi:hypothetical protein
MRKQIEFTITDTESFFRLTNTYFLMAGFKKSVETENKISFTKGNMLLNMVTFNPLNWKSLVTVSLLGNKVVADFDINTVGQMVTAREEKLWDTFVENFKVSLTQKADVTKENKEQLAKTKKDSLKYILWAVLGAIVLGVPFGFLAHFTGVDILAPAGGALGAVLFMMWKVNRDKKKAE